MNDGLTAQIRVVDNPTMNPAQHVGRVAMFKEDGTPITLTEAEVAQTGANVLLTGYAAHAAGDVLATDSTNVAIAKLEARIAELELLPAAITALTARVTALEGA